MSINRKIAIASDSGYLGVGTNTPSAPLDVVGNANITGSLIITANTNLGGATISGTGANTSLTLVGTGASGGTYRISTTSNGHAEGDNKLLFQGGESGTTPRMAINSSGNVGIGTTNPSGILHAYWSTDNATGGMYLTNISAGVSAYGGIYFGNSTSNTDAFVGVLGTNNANYGGARSFLLGTNSAAAVVIMTQGTEKVRISSDGNAGVGTTNPQTRLHAYISVSDQTAGGRTTALDVLTVESRNTGAQEYNGFGQAIVFRGTTYNNTTPRTLSRIVGKINDDSTQTRGTSIHFETSDTASNSNAPTEKMVINYAGNVGIGTTNPGGTYGKLTVAGGIKTTDDVSSKLELGRYSAGVPNSYIKLGTNSNALFITNAADSADIFTILNGGNVGIGTTTPGSDVSMTGGLEINGTNSTQLTIGKSGTRALAINVSESATGDVNFYDKVGGGYTRVMTFNTGKVGIGIVSPISKLHVLTSGTAFTVPSQGNIGASNTNRVNFVGTEPGLMLNSDLNGAGVQTGTGITSLGLQIGYYNTNDIRSQVFWAGNAPLTFTYSSSPSGSLSERMRIDTSGNVGIGTTSPAYKLDVNGVINTNTGMYVQYPYGDAYALQLIGTSFLKANANYYGMLIRSGDTNYISGKFVIYGGTNKRVEIGGYEESVGAINTVIPYGNFGIGTATPNAKLDVSGNTTVSGSLTVAGIVTVTGSMISETVDTHSLNAKNSILLGTNSTATVSIANRTIYVQGGNTGIGKSVQPLYATLDVSGSAIITGSLAVTQAITASSLVVTNLTVQTITASNEIITGSSQFGTLSTNKHQFTGSVEITGSLAINGATTTTIIESLRANRSISGGGVITVDSSYNVLWSSRFIVISSGYGSNFTTNGYFDITCPTSGTITGVGGAASVTATAAGIPVGNWCAIYYILPIGSNNTSVAANFRVATYTSALDIPHDWVLICVRNNDNGYLYFPNGIVLGSGESSTGGLQTSTNVTNSVVKRDNSGNFSAGSISLSNTLSVDTIRNTSGDAMLGYSSNIFTLGSGNVSQVVKFNAGGSERMRIDSSGNVGINTTSPAALLNILAGSGTTDGTVAMRIGGLSNYPCLEFGTTNTYDGFIRSYGNDLKYYAGHWRTTGTAASENHRHYWYTSKNGSTDWSTVKMVLTEDGYLGVGQSNPTYRVEVAGSAGSGGLVRLGSIDYTTTTVLSVAPGVVDFDAPGSSGGRFKINSIGNVGISSAVPVSKLHVVSGSGAASVGSLPAGTTATFDSSGNNYLLFRNTADNNTHAGLLFQDNNVGAYITFRNYAGSGTNDGTNGDALYYGTYTDHIFQAGSSETVGARTEIFRIKQSGKTVFYSGVWHNSSDGYERFHFGASDTTYFKAPNSTFVFRNSSDVAMMTLNTTGLAIGSSNPSYKLDVSGAVGVAGNINFDATSGRSITWGLNTDAAFIKFVSTGNASGLSYLEIGTTDDSDEPIKFTQSGNIRALIDTDGRLKANVGFDVTGTATVSSNVGIGTTSPGALLHVGSASTGNFKLDSNGSGGHYYQSEAYPRLGIGRDYDGPAGYISFNRDGAQNTNKVAISSPAALEMGFYVGTTEKIRMNSSGNLGIGTTSPTNAKLQISSGGISTQDSTRTFAGETFNTAIGSSHTRTLAFNGSGGSSVWWCNSGTPVFAIDTMTNGATFWTYNAGWSQRLQLDGNGFGVNTTAPLVKLTTRSGANSLPATSGTSQSGAGLRVEGGDNAVIDIGTNSVQTWIQATDKSALNNFYYLMLNPRGGNVGVNTTSNPAYSLEVNGSFAATTKSFVIKHPTKEGKKLEHGVVEGPEHSVFVRGKTTSNKIVLPEYWTGLVHEDTITVQLTSIGKHQNLAVVDVNINEITIENQNTFNKNINCYYLVQAERKDIPKLVVEV